MRRALACVVLLIAGCPPAPARPRPLPALPVDAYEHYLRGRTAFFEGDYQLAVPELEQAMAAGALGYALNILFLLLERKIVHWSGR